MLDISSGECRDFLPPAFRRKIQIFRTHQISHSTSFVHLSDPRPEAVEFRTKKIWLVEQNGGARKQIEDRPVRSCYGCIELPAWKNGDSARANGSFDNLFGCPRNALARKSGMDRSQQLIRDGRF